MERSGPEAAVRQVVIGVTDLDAAVWRYRDGLGFQVEFCDPSGWAVLTGPHVTLALATEDQHDNVGPVTLTLRTDDLDTTLAHLQQHGFETEGPLMRGGHEIRQRCRDADGTAVWVYRPFD